MQAACSKNKKTATLKLYIFIGSLKRMFRFTLHIICSLPSYTLSVHGSCMDDKSSNEAVFAPYNIFSFRQRIGCCLWIAGDKLTSLKSSCLILFYFRTTKRSMEVCVMLRVTTQLSAWEWWLGRCGPAAEESPASNPLHIINITITYLGDCGPMTYSLLFITSLLFQIQAI